MTSIRTRLLLFFLLLFNVSWLTVALATYLEARHEVEELFDAQLAQAAGILRTLDFRLLETRESDKTSLEREIFGHKYEKQISFQIWNRGRLILRSQNAPEQRMSDRVGYVDRMVGDEKWRVFAMHMVDDGMIFAGENYAIREELQHAITLNVLVPLVWAIPLLMISIWIGVGRGLEPVRRLAREVAARSPEQLDPVDNERVPHELLPVTLGLNNLLAKVASAFNRERQFTANAAHELRTPLATIRTHTQIAQRATDSQEREQAFQNILHGIERGTRLVEQMLTLERLDPDLDLFDAVDLARVSESVLAELGHRAVEREVELSLDAGPSGVGRINGFLPGIEILLRNLILNSLDHTPSGGNIQVAVKAEGEMVILTVSDTGSGIPEDEMDKVFDRFYRPAGSLRSGCGLGLAIVKQVVDLHRGRIELRPAEQGSGLTVIVVFECYRL